MNIVLCNKYFFLNGGTEKYLRVLLTHLPRHGHRAIPFSVNYAGSWPSDYSAYFLDPPAGPSQTNLSSITVTPRNFLPFLGRSIYSREAQRSLGRLLDAVGPVHVGYVLNIYNYMSPSIIATLHKRRIPVVMQLGDYHLICPAYTLLRDGKPCTTCVTGAYYHGLRHRCVKRHLAASAVRVAAMYLQKWIGIYKLVAAFVVPCAFMRDMLVRGGFSRERIHMLRYPIAPEDLPPSPMEKQNYILYAGRLSREKGIDTLINAYQRLAPPVDLVIAGRSYDAEEERLRAMVLPVFRDRIRFVGFQEGHALSGLIGGALCSVLPSRWYDNAPLSIYESFAHYTPVVASRIGGIPEQVEDKITGRLFEPDNVQELSDALAWMLADRDRLAAMGRAGRTFVEQSLDLDRHLSDLAALFARVREECTGV